LSPSTLSLEVAVSDTVETSILSRISVPKEYAEAIGLVAVHWSALEASIEFGIWYLLGMLDDEKRANTLTAEINIVPRLHAVSSLLHLEGDQLEIAAWKKLRKRIDDLRDRRNKVIHSQWKRTGPNIIVATKTTSRGVLKPVIERKTVEDIHKLASEIADCYGKTESFFIAHFLGR
jgi:hypothetical protein